MRALARIWYKSFTEAVTGSWGSAWQWPGTVTRLPLRQWTALTGEVIGSPQALQARACHYWALLRSYGCSGAVLCAHCSSTAPQQNQVYKCHIFTKQISCRVYDVRSPNTPRLNIWMCISEPRVRIRTRRTDWWSSLLLCKTWLWWYGNNWTLSTIW